MSGPSHGLHLVLKLAGHEARHARAALLTKDHLFLGLLKLVDIGLEEYLSELSVAEQLATTGEVADLRHAFGNLDTTALRRSLRALAASQERAGDDLAATPRPSRECEKVLSQLSSTMEGWGCLGLLSLILEAPGKSTAEQFTSDGINPETILARMPRGQDRSETPKFARSVIQLHHEWRTLGGDKAPELSDLWRRIAPAAVLEFDGKGGVSLMQGGHCLMRLSSSQAESRRSIFGDSLAAAINEFEQGALPHPCKAPLAEF